MRDYLFNMDWHQLWENISEKVITLVYFVASKLIIILEPIYQKALNNPAAAGAILLALVGIPLIFIKMNKTNTKKEGRLDQFVEEMETFTGGTPMVNLQKKFQNPQFNNPTPAHAGKPTKFDPESEEYEIDFERDEGILEIDHENEKLESDLMVDLPNLVANEETSKSETYFFSEDQEIADTALPEESVDHLTETGDLNLEPEPLSAQDSDWSQISPPTLSGYDDTEFYNDTELTNFNDTELTNEEMDGLMEKMEESTQKKPLEIFPEINAEDSTQEMNIDSVFPTLESIEPQSQDEGFEKTDTTDGAGILFHPAEEATEQKAPSSQKSEEDHEYLVEDDAHPETPLEALKNNFKAPVSPTVSSPPEAKVKEAHQAQNFFLRPVPKSTGMSSNARPKYSGKDYEKLLESFILLKDQNR